MIRIGRESQGLPYAGFFILYLGRQFSTSAMVFTLTWYFSLSTNVVLNICKKRWNKTKFTTGLTNSQQYCVVIVVVPILNKL